MSFCTQWRHQDMAPNLWHVISQELNKVLTCGFFVRFYFRSTSVYFNIENEWTSPLTTCCVVSFALLGNKMLPPTLGNTLITSRFFFLKLGSVQKWRHAKFDKFWPPPPLSRNKNNRFLLFSNNICHNFHTPSPYPPTAWRHFWMVPFIPHPLSHCTNIQ